MSESLPDLRSGVAADSEAAADPVQALAASVDRHVGLRVRERRTMLGLSQQQLAAILGVTYQQQHKYERGLNRISAGRLYTMAEALAVPVAWFFDGLVSEAEELSPRRRLALELSRNFAAIDNEKHQDALSQMARALAAQSLRIKTEVG